MKLWPKVFRSSEDDIRARRTMDGCEIKIGKINYHIVHRVPFGAIVGRENDNNLHFISEEDLKKSITISNIIYPKEKT